MKTRAAGADTARPDAGSPEHPALTDAPRRPTALVAVAVLLGIVLAAALAVWWGGDGAVTTQPEPVPAGGQPPAGLGLTVDGPAEARVGEEVAFTVHWADDGGIFSGGSEDWGDGVATSSLQQGRCAPAGPPPSAAAGSYTATHSWSEPGTYAVVVGVSTYACEGGTAVVEDASRRIEIVVRAAG
jgi:hypothetical protein